MRKKLLFSIMVLLTIYLIATGFRNKELSDIYIMHSILPNKSLEIQGDNVFVDNEGKHYYIESKIYGHFIKKNRRELLVIVRPYVQEQSHAMGYYNAYCMVFDKYGKKQLSELIAFSADKGQLALFEGKDLNYLFFIGETIYQGWGEWNGGLYRAGTPWTLLWPGEQLFWKDKAAKVNKEGLDLFYRKTDTSINQLIPNYSWEPYKKLKWNKEKIQFE